MIFDLFLPKKLGSYYLFTQRIAGIEVSKTHIRATILSAKESSITIEQCIDVPIETNRDISADQRIINALRTVKDLLPTRCQIHSVLQSTLVTYKELLLPFTSHETIAQVVKFEIEPLLPFRVDQAIIDFIITKTMPEEQSVYIMAAAIQKQHVAHHIALFEQAGITPHAIITDLFALYNFYLQIPPYSSLSGNIILMDMGLHITRIAFVSQGQLRFIRTINSGLSSCAKYVGDQLQIPTTQALEQILRFGFEKNQHEPHVYEAIIQGCTQLWHNIRLTLSSFTVHLKSPDTINKALILQEGSPIAGLSSFMSSYLDIPCESFDAYHITENSSIKLGKQIHSIPNAHSISLGAALPSDLTENFSLRKEEFTIDQSFFYIKQLIAVITLVLCIFGSLIIFNVLRVHAISTALDTAQQEAITELQERFKAVDEDETDLEAAIEKAQDELQKEEATWFAFSNKSRFLQYLLELTNRIDKKELGLVTEEISITPTTIILKARVKNTDALKDLERELKQSKLFGRVEPQEKTPFSMKIDLANPQGE